MAEPNFESSWEHPMHIDKVSENYIKSTGKWARVLAILGFIVVGIMVLGSFSMGSILRLYGVSENNPMTGAMSVGITLFYLMLAAVYFIPILYLFRFSDYAGSAIRLKDEDSLRNAFRYLNAHYRFVGIMALVLIGFYVLMIIAVIIFGAAFGGAFF